MDQILNWVIMASFDVEMIPFDCPTCGAAFRETSGMPIPQAVWDHVGFPEELRCVGCNQPFARRDPPGKYWERISG